MELHRWMLAALATSTMTFGCAEPGGSTNEPPETLTLSDREDLYNGVQRRGELEFGEAVQGELTLDFEMHAYTISAKRGAALTLEVTHRGSSSGLDTLLYLYAPTDEGYVRIARDDDDGWGQLSRIEIELRKDGDFLAVIGTRDGLGRGSYRLELTCDSGDCTLVPPPVEAWCMDSVFEMISECVIEDVDESTSGEYEPYTDVGAAVARCVSEEQALWYHEIECQLGDDEWCFEDFDTFFVAGVMSECEALAVDDFVVPNPAALTPFTIEGLAQLELSADDPCTELGGCEIELVGLAYEGEATLREIGESARMFTARPWETSVGDVVDDPASEIASFNDLDHYLGGLYDSIVQRVGSSEVEALHLGATYERGWSYTIEDDITLLHFRSEQRVVLVIQSLEL